MKLDFLCAKKGGTAQEERGTESATCNTNMGVAISQLLPKKQIQLAGLAGTRLAIDAHSVADHLSGSIDPELIELDDVLKKVELTREQLVLLGLLVGTDYNEGIKGAGPADALRRLQEYRTFERALATTPLATDANIRTVYEFFLNPPHTVRIRLESKPPAVDKLRAFLVRDHDFSPERVEATLQRLPSPRRAVDETVVKTFAAQ